VDVVPVYLDERRAPRDDRQRYEVPEVKLELVTVQILKSSRSAVDDVAVEKRVV
jgi:hypothetical protein